MIIEGINIPDKWCELLTSLQKTDPTAMLAGGSLRDLSLGCAPKDVDIFSTHIPMVDGLDSGDIDYEGMQYVKGVVTYKTDLDLPFNLVIHEPCSNQEMLESFDFGICQIGFTGKELIRTPAYNWDFKHGVFTLRHIDRYPRSIKRYARWLNRYDWDISIPKLDATKLLPEVF